MIGVIEQVGDARWLAERWRRRFDRWADGHAQVGGELVSRYAAPERVYHDVRHLRQVLEAVDELTTEEPLSGRLECVELAAWFHDAVYDVRRSDNEAASAALAEELLAPYVEPEPVAEVVRLVLLTRDHAVPDGDRNGAVVCDADLAVLGGSSDEYDAYVRRVRAEYAHVPEPDFRAKRAVVLQGLLDLPALFHTGLGVQRWEAAARANMLRELALLG